MTFRIKLLLFVFSALLVDLVPLGLSLRSDQTDLAGWHSYKKIIELLEYLILIPCLTYLPPWLDKREQHRSRESSH
jgi:hypothetical protein